MRGSDQGASPVSLPPWRRGLRLEGLLPLLMEAEHSGRGEARFAEAASLAVLAREIISPAWDKRKLGNV